MRNKVNSVLPETTRPPDQKASRATGFKRFGKKFYAITALIAVVIIAIAFLIPQSSAIIPLSVDYTVGEKMVYDTTVTATFQVHNTTQASAFLNQSPNNTRVKATQSIEVIDFDGEYYTINHTTTMVLNDKPFSLSMIEKMNKTGYSTYILSLGNTQQEIPNTSITSNSYLTQLLSKPEVKVGDTVNVPLPSINSRWGIKGDLSLTFGGFEDLSVPAGTYKVFRIDITSNNLRMDFNPSTSINMEMSYQIYMEYGTMRQIKSTMQETVSYQATMMNYTMYLTMEMTLEQHIKT